MSAIQIKNVPPDVFEAAHRRAASEGLTLSQYLLRLLREDLEFPSQQEWLARLKSREPVEGVDVVAELDAARAEREQELWEAWRCRSL